MSYKLPTYRPTKFTKMYVFNKLGRMPEVIKVLNISKRIFRNWGKHVPAPYADRLVLSNWGENTIEPRYVLVEDALIIFKTFPFMAKHFGRSKTWKQDMLYLPELESAFMIRNFPKFMRVFTRTELEERHLC